MILFLFRWDLFLEVALPILILLGIIIAGSILSIRKLQTNYKDLFRNQSKFDIELRKTSNLMSKLIDNESLNKYQDVVIKELPYEEKKNLLELIQTLMQTVDKTDDINRYLVETFDHLEELRLVLDSKILSFNQLISIFPFSIYARILKYHKLRYYSHK